MWVPRISCTFGSNSTSMRCWMRSTSNDHKRCIDLSIYLQEVLQNSNKPIPEDFDAISDFRVVNKASVKLSNFISRVFGDPEINDVVKVDESMSFTETTLNKVRKQQVTIHRLKSLQVNGNNGGNNIIKLRKKVGELSTLNSNLSDENSTMKTLLNNQAKTQNATPPSRSNHQGGQSRTASTKYRNQ